MIPMTIVFGDNDAWPDLHDKAVTIVDHADHPVQIAVLDHHLLTGRPSIAIRLDLPDGSTVIAETTARMFVIAGRMVVAKYPNLFDGEAR